MNDKSLKDMWNQAQQYLDDLNYDGSTIEGFMSRNSKSVTENILKILRRDIIMKMVIALILIIDILIYFPIQANISYACALAFFFLLILIAYENRNYKLFSSLSDNHKNTKEKLLGMQMFLNNHSFANLLSISSSYLFGYNAGMLLYFFAEYGQLRKMGSMDYIVFPAICIMGIIYTYIYNGNIIKYQQKHIKLCLSDLDEEVKPMVLHELKKEQSKEKTITILVSAVILLSFLLVVIIFKKLGF